MTIAGEGRNWRVAGDSGNEKVHAFCPICGTPVYPTFEAMPQLIAVHAASLDDPSQFNPQLVTDSIGGHAWDTMDPALRHRANAAKSNCGVGTRHGTQVTHTHSGLVPQEESFDG